MIQFMPANHSITKVLFPKSCTQCSSIHKTEKLIWNEIFLLHEVKLEKQNIERLALQANIKVHVLINCIVAMFKKHMQYSIW